MAGRLLRAQQVERNRQGLLAAAKSVFIRKGYLGATLDSIAKEAGFSKGAIYSQFGSKADLFFALLEDRIEERAKRNEQIAAAGDGKRAVSELIRSASRNETAERGWARLLIEFRATAMRDPSLATRYADLHERTLHALSDTLARAFRADRTHSEIPLRTLAEFILAADSGLTLERAVNPRALPERDFVILVPKALGLGATPRRSVKATHGRHPRSSPR
jgi:AcrR family transcriptional regulator